MRLTLSASQHNYERTCPVLSTGRVHTRHGHGHHRLQRVHRWGQPALVREQAGLRGRRFSDTYGWLSLSLHPDGSFDWRFVPVVGTSTDAGSRPAPRPGP